MTSRGSDLTPLAERLGLLQIGRIAAAFAVLGIPALTGDAPELLLPLALGYVGLTAALELVRWRARARALHLVAAMLLLDALFLAAATTLTGGPRSPLLFLMLLDVLAVTLLASYRSGVKVAIWCALLLFLGQAAIRAGVVTSTEPAGDRDVALGAAAFLVVAMVAAAFSAVNERALRASRGQLAALVDLDAALARAVTSREVGRSLATYARDHLGFRRVAVIAEAGESWLAVVARADGELTFGPCPPPSGGDVVRSDDDVALGDAVPWRLVKRLDASGTLAAELPDAHGVAVVELGVDGTLLGVVAGEWTGDERARIPSLTVQSLAQAADHSALSLRHLALLSEVESLATVDPLTGISNRRAFDDALERELHRARRLGDSATVVLLDVDHFKRINDEQGHLAGDEALRSIAQAIAKSTKGFDVVARVGGDEFAVFLPDCALEDAEDIVQRLCASVGDATTGIPVTVSAGWATFPEHGDDRRTLLGAADAALYRAKRAGRARVASAQSTATIRCFPSAG